MNQDQVKGVLDRVVAMGAVWVVSKGYISASDAAQYAPLLIGVAAAAWGWWINRDKALLQSAAAVPGTVVVTHPDLAQATPETNIVSSGSNAVVPK